MPTLDAVDHVDVINKKHADIVALATMLHAVLTDSAMRLPTAEDTALYAEDILPGLACVAEMIAEQAREGAEHVDGLWEIVRVGKREGKRG